jgi:hypothetical protein
LLLPKQCDVHAQLSFPSQYVVHQKRLLFRQWLVHDGDVLVHVAQLHGSGGAGVGVGFGVGDATGLGVGVGAGFGRGVGLGCGVALGGLVGAGVDEEVGSVVRLGSDRGTGAAGDAACGARCAARSPVAVGEGSGVPRAPMVRTVAVVALNAPLPARDPRRPSSVHRRLIAGICPTHAPMPMVRQRRPTEMFKNARTTIGSSCVPATRVSSCRAAAMLIARLYGRGAVITSYTSATATIRAASDI